MTTRAWRTLEKFNLKQLAKQGLEAEPGTEVQWDLEYNEGGLMDAYVEEDNGARNYICSMNTGGQITEIHPDYANHFGNSADDNFTAASD